MDCRILYAVASDTETPSVCSWRCRSWVLTKSSSRSRAALTANRCLVTRCSRGCSLDCSPWPVPEDAADSDINPARFLIACIPVPKIISRAADGSGPVGRRRLVPMKLTKYTHACIRLDKDGKGLVLDPGTFSESEEALRGANAVLVTHEHPDHLDTKAVVKALADNPGLTVHAPTGVASALRQ